MGGLFEDVAKCPDFSPVVQHLKLFEQFLLQCGGTCLPFGFQGLYAGFVAGD